MPTFEIQQFELHVMTYRVEAGNECEAIVQLLDGQAEPVNDSLEYVELAEDVGLPVDEYRDLAAQLIEFGVPVGEHVIPTICSVAPFEMNHGFSLETTGFVAKKVLQILSLKLRW